MEEQKRVINGIAHQIYTWGNPKNPPLFMIHGWMDSGLSFRPLAENLADQFYCIAPDLRGYGKSEHTTDPTGYYFEQFFCDIHDLFSLFTPPNEPVYALGHSMGGNILTYYSGAFPERINKLISLEGIGTFENELDEGPLLIRKWIQSRGKITPRRYSNPETFQTVFSVRNPGIPKDVLAEISEGLISQSGSEEEEPWKLRADLKHFMPFPGTYRHSDLIPYYRRMTAPLLVVVGTRSSYLKMIGIEKADELHLRKFLKEVPRLSLAFLEGCGHMLHLEQPGVLAKVIAGFLKSG